jgi:hypothetical protein
VTDRPSPGEILPTDTRVVESDARGQDPLSADVISILDTVDIPIVVVASIARWFVSTVQQSRPLALRLRTSAGFRVPSPHWPVRGI